MRVPAATYRLQFNEDFRFPDAIQLVPLLHRLGISHIYASPIFAARPGSTHGYDVVDPNRLNPILGTDAEFERMVEMLRSRGMGLILDIVPNHMASSTDNPWWMDVLENGSASPYAGYFGINWYLANENGGEKIYLPWLGSFYAEVLERGELKLSYEENGFRINYYERQLPVDVSTYDDILEGAPIDDLLDAIRRLAPREAKEWEAVESRNREKDSIKRQLWSLYTSDDALKSFVDERIQVFNGTPGDPRSFDPLHNLLEQQAYRLAFWRMATERINYRRFFDVSDLIGVRVENAPVFEATHQLIFRLIESHKIDGVRVDHIDGLFNPEQYLERLAPRSPYTVVEKILTDGEPLPESWPIQGTSGYEFLGMTNGLLVEPEGLKKLSAAYAGFSGVKGTLEDVEYERRVNIIDNLFMGEMRDLASFLDALAQDDRHSRDLSPSEMGRALTEITANMPVYRTYTSSLEVSDGDRRAIDRAVEHARRRETQVSARVFDFIRQVLTLDFPDTVPDERRKTWLKFVMRWQQISGPIMAKGVEDSAFYVYNLLISLNEVGSVPRPLDLEEFHAFLSERCKKWPGAMNATSTHDTKRSEDVRARLNVLSEVPGEWLRGVNRWRRALQDIPTVVSPNDEYLLLQTLIGAWPIHTSEMNTFRERLKAYVVKAAREARQHTSWLHPSEEYEKAFQKRVDDYLDNEKFLAAFRPLQQRVAFYGAMNSLSQLLLKITAPGLPDFYRGTLCWDFSLVDPDNRRPAQTPVLTDFSEKARRLIDHWEDGAIKVFLAEKALAFRKVNYDLFLAGEYIPVYANGSRKDHVVAFLRKLGKQWVLVVAPRWSSKLSVTIRPPIGIHAWHDTALELPPDAPRRWRNVITGETMLFRESRIPMFRALAHFPVGFFANR